MSKKHYLLTLLIFASTSIASYFFDARISEALTQNLVTFFSIVFGFYATTMAIIFGSRYALFLYEKITPDGAKREIHVLKDYFLKAGYCTLLSIFSIIFLMVFGYKDKDGYLTLMLPVVFGVKISDVFNALVLGLATVNVFLMILVFNFILDGMLKTAWMQRNQRDDTKNT